MLKILLSLGVVITFFGNATFVLPLRLRHLKHWKRKLTPFYSNLTNPELKYNQFKLQKPIEVLQNNK